MCNMRFCFKTQRFFNISDQTCSKWSQSMRENMAHLGLIWRPTCASPASRICFKIQRFFIDLGSIFGRPGPRFEDFPSFWERFCSNFVDFSIAFWNRFLMVLAPKIAPENYSRRSQNEGPHFQLLLQPLDIDSRLFFSVCTPYLQGHVRTLPKAHRWHQICPVTLHIAQ